MPECPICLEQVHEQAQKCPSCHEWISNNKTEDGEKIEKVITELERRKLLQETHHEIEKDLKAKYAWIGALVIFLSGGGITLMVNGVISGATKNVAIADAIQKRSLRTLDDIDESVKKLSKFESELQNTSEVASDLDKKFRELQEKSALVSEQLTKHSKESLKLTDELRSQLKKVTDLVSSLSKAEQEGRNLGAVKEGAKEIQSSLDKTEKDIAKAIKKVNKGAYPITLYDFNRGEFDPTNLSVKLEESGYLVQLTDVSWNSRNLLDYESISIGKKVPANIAVPVIRLALENVEHLKYLRFRPKDKDQSTIVVGATTKRSEQLGIRPMDKSVLISQLNSQLELTEFHKIIQDNYPTAKRELEE